MPSILFALYNHENTTGANQEIALELKGLAADPNKQVAAYAATKTTRLKFLLAHRPGFVAPTLAARQLATLDQFTDGLGIHGGIRADGSRPGGLGLNRLNWGA